MGKKDEPVDEKAKSDEFLVDIGKRVRRIREANGTTQRELGAAAGGISAAYIYLVEKGQQNLTLAVFKRIADGLKVPMEDLLGAEEPGAVPTERSLGQMIRSSERLIAELKTHAERQAEILKETERLRLFHEELLTLISAKDGKRPKAVR